MAGSLHARLSGLTLSLRVLITAFICSLAVAYGVSLLQIFNRTEMDAQKTVAHFRGSDDPGGMYVPQSNATLISVAHVHTFSQPVVIGLMGLLFVLCSQPESHKILWVVVSFLGSLLSNAGPWLIRDLSPKFVVLLYSAGTAMLVGFFVMAVVVLNEVWSRVESTPGDG